MPPRCFYFSHCPFVVYPSVFSMNSSAEQADAGGCFQICHTGSTNTPKSCECCGALQGKDVHGTGWVAEGQRHCHGLVCMALLGQLQERGCLQCGGTQRTTQQGRCGSWARSPACQDVLLLAEGAHEASLERARQRRWPAPWEEGRAAGCDDSRPHTSRKCRERNQVEGANKAGAPAGRPGGGALPGTCPRDDSGKRLPGEEERE